MQSTRNPINIHKSQNKASLACNHLHVCIPHANDYDVIGGDGITGGNAAAENSTPVR